MLHITNKMTEKDIYMNITYIKNGILQSAFKRLIAEYVRLLYGQHRFSFPTDIFYQYNAQSEKRFRRLYHRMAPSSNATQ